MILRNWGTHGLLTQLSETEPVIESTSNCPPLTCAVRLPLPVMPKLGSPERVQSYVVALAEPTVSTSKQTALRYFHRIISPPISPHIAMVSFGAVGQGKSRYLS